MKEKKFDLQDRFIDFAVRIIRLSEAIPESKAGRHICTQVLRSGTSRLQIMERRKIESPLGNWKFLVEYWIFK